MSEKRSDNTNAEKNHSGKATLAAILNEVEQTPEEQWETLLQVIRQFRQSLKMQPSPTEAWEAVMKQIHSQDLTQQAARQQALSDLLQSWEEEGDEQEQKETWEFLKQALNKDRLSNRPLFPYY
ncbi:hypothetical protein [Dulcicalothrix desertica]|nr:hypothetical protein [Dulcicalothrix desertica]TWH54263.1 hypothetical protein CAL7102_02280 [Dulcicalothrix desertica PCC 7102]